MLKESGITFFGEKPSDKDIVMEVVANSLENICNLMPAETETASYLNRINSIKTSEGSIKFQNSETLFPIVLKVVIDKEKRTTIRIAVGNDSDILTLDLFFTKDNNKFVNVTTNILRHRHVGDSVIPEGAGITIYKTIPKILSKLSQLTGIEYRHKIVRVEQMDEATWLRVFGDFIESNGYVYIPERSDDSWLKAYSPEK